MSVDDPQRLTVYAPPEGGSNGYQFARWMTNPAPQVDDRSSGTVVVTLTTGRLSPTVHANGPGAHGS